MNTRSACTWRQIVPITAGMAGLTAEVASEKMRSVSIPEACAHSKEHTYSASSILQALSVSLLALLPPLHPKPSAIAHAQLGTFLHSLRTCPNRHPPSHAHHIPLSILHLPASQLKLGIRSLRPSSVIVHKPSLIPSFGSVDTDHLTVFVSLQREIVVGLRVDLFLEMNDPEVVANPGSSRNGFATSVVEACNLRRQLLTTHSIPRLTCCTAKRECRRFDGETGRWIWEKRRRTGSAIHSGQRLGEALRGDRCC